MYRGIAKKLSSGGHRAPRGVSQLSCPTPRCNGSLRAHNLAKESNSDYSCVADMAWCGFPRPCVTDSIRRAAHNDLQKCEHTEIA